MLGEVESPNRISSQVQLTRSGTLAPKDQNDDDSLNAGSNHRLEKMTTFNIDESPSKSRLNQSVSSQSPHRHTNTHKEHNTHNYQNLASLYYIDQANQSDQLKTQTDYLKKVSL